MRLHGITPAAAGRFPANIPSDLRLALSRLAGPMQFEFTEDEKKDLAMQFERVLREFSGASAAC